MSQPNRSQYLGSADAASIVNLEPYGCRRSMVMRKSGVPVDDAERHRERFDSDEGPVRRGVMLEPLIRERIRDTMTDCREWDESFRNGEAPGFLRATPDGLILAQDEDARGRMIAAMRLPDSPRLRVLLQQVGILEAKTVQTSELWRIRKEGPRPDHVIQVQHQLAATAAPWCLIAYLNADQWRWAYFLIERDPTWERESYIPAAIDAWAQITRAQSGIQLGASPDEWEPFLPARLPEGSKQCRTCDRKRLCWGSEYLRVMEIPVEGDLPSMEGDPAWESAAMDYRAAKEVYDEAEALKEDATARLKEILGDLPGAQGAGLKVYYKPSVQNSLDTKALTKALPEVAAQFTKQITVRALRAYEV